MGIAPFAGYAGRHAAENIRLLFGHRFPLEHYPYERIRSRIPAEQFLERTPQDRADFLQLLENRMACGLGACLGCVVKPRLDGKRPLPPEWGDNLPVPSCQCGPVFWADSVEIPA
jgi:dihydroorotate dehydrogenase electron transfer subunit